MNQITAQEKFASYMNAELNGQDELAQRLERELNEAGWFITGKDGRLNLEQRGKSSGTSKGFDTSLLPRENNSPHPYSSETEEKKTGRILWITIGVLMGLTALSFLVIYLIKRKSYVPTTV